MSLSLKRDNMWAHRAGFRIKPDDEYYVHGYLLNIY